MLAKLCKSLTTVESDKQFLAAVAKSLQASSNIYYLHGDIGKTKSYGQPLRILKWKNFKKYPTYALTPWTSNDLPRSFSGVFIDGRFRVSCVLATLIYNEESHYQILLDDYYSRPEYSVIEQLVDKPVRIGNAALFEVDRNRIDVDRALYLQEIYKYDFS